MFVKQVFIGNMVGFVVGVGVDKPDAPSWTKSNPAYT